MENNHYNQVVSCQQQGHKKGEPDPLTGAIFQMDSITRDECFQQEILKLPASCKPFKRQVKEGMHIFLFDVVDRKMYGVFKAASDVGMDLLPEAVSLTSRTYPTEVRLNIACMCQPLTESEYKPAISEKYVNSRMSRADLSSDEVHRLLVLFEAKRITSVPLFINESLGMSYTDSSMKRSDSNCQDDTMPNLDSGATPKKNSDLNMEAARRFMQWLTDFVKAGNINLPQPIVGNPTTTQNQTNNNSVVGSYQYPTDADPCLVQSPQAMQISTPNPLHPANGIMSGGTSSNLFGGLQGQGHLYHGSTELQACVLNHTINTQSSHTVQLVCHMETTPHNPVGMSDHTVNDLLSHSQPPLKHGNGGFSPLGPNERNPVCVSIPTNEDKSSQCAVPVQICALVGGHIVPDPSPTVAEDITELNPTTSEFHMSTNPDETHSMPPWVYKSDVEVTGDKKKRKLIRPSLGAEPTTLELNMTISPDETRSLPPWNYKRIEGNDKSDAEVAVSKKKRKLIRPSLEADTTKSESIMTMSPAPDGFHSMPVLNCKRRRWNGKSDSEVAGGKKNWKLIRPSLDPKEKDCGYSTLKLPIGICKDEGQIKQEIEGLLQQEDFAVSGGPLLKSEICPDKLQQRPNIESGGVFEADILGLSQWMSDRMNLAGSLFCEGQVELLEAKQEMHLLNAGSINSVLVNELIDTRMLESEEDDFNVNLCPRITGRNPVEESAAIESEASSCE